MPTKPPTSKRCHSGYRPEFQYLFLLLLLSACALAQSQTPEPKTVRISVLSLFHPKALTLTATHPLTIALDNHTITVTQATITSTSTGLTLNGEPTQTLTLPETTFALAVPNKLIRQYRGALAITNHHGILQPILTLDTELAVASIVQAESPPHAPIESLKAQAVISRSYLLARPGPHAGFDACDTTHCQFLRSPPSPNSLAARATRETRNQVLTWRAMPESQPQIIPAMYSRSCGGHTRPHPTTPDAYPFYRVACNYCLRHPEAWSRPAPAQPLRTEQQRLAWNRTHGWSAVPSNTHSSGPTLTGRGTGHGIGLCQLGAADLASHGASYEKIVAHFFPDTTLSYLP